MASERPEPEARSEPSEEDADGGTQARPSRGYESLGDARSAGEITDPDAASPSSEAARARESVPPDASSEWLGAGEASESPSERPSEPPGDGPRRSRFEKILPGLIRRGIEKGIEAGIHTLERSVETGRGTTDAVRGVLSEVRLPRDVANAVGRALTEAKLPRELASAVFTQLDETKNDVLRIVAGEVRDFLDATDLAGELKAALTSLSFEIRTEVRFIPNDAGTGVRPDIRARSRVRRARDNNGSEQRSRRAPPEKARKARRERKPR